MYPIKCSTLHFKPSKSQKKTLRKFKSYIENGKKEPASVPGSADGAASSGGAGGGEDMVVVERAAAIQDRLAGDIGQPKLNTSSSAQEKQLPENEEVTGTTEAAESVLVAQSPGPSTENISKPPPTNGITSHGSTPRMKGKLFRRERWRQRQLEKGMEVVVEPRAGDSGAKELEDWLVYPEEGAAHRFRTRLLPADPDDPQFAATFDESLSVYQKYQMAVHGDTQDKCSASQYKRFLCKVRRYI